MNIAEIEKLIKDVQKNADNCAAAAEASIGTHVETVYRHSEYELLHIIDRLQKIANEHYRTNHIFKMLTAREGGLI